MINDQAIVCECGKILSDEEIRENKRIAKETKAEQLNMCQRCWHDYCGHAITGE